MTDSPLSHLRRDYRLATLDERSVDPDPLRQFETWFEEARAADILEPNAMTLATSTPDGRPSARVVLLKGIERGAFVFFTDYRSRKGEELDANPRAALVFFWKELERQVRIEGSVERASAEESLAYFRVRPLGSRLGAWTSHQSSVIASRDALEDRLRVTEARFAGSEDVPLPPHWGGYRVMPESIEFWQGRTSRLHDRLRFAREPRGDATSWRLERLSP